jgi:biopolymer transport protein ExbD
MHPSILFAAVALLAAPAVSEQTPPLRAGVSVQMAVASHAGKYLAADEPQSLVVAITGGGQVYLEVTRLTPAAPAAKLQPALAASPGKPVFLKADARTPSSTVAEVLDAIRSAGAAAPVLLTAQKDAAPAPYLPPMGLPVRLPAPSSIAARPEPIRIGSGHPTEAELRQRVQAGVPVILQPDPGTPFGDLVNVIDFFRGAGSAVYLASPGK